MCDHQPTSLLQLPNPYTPYTQHPTSYTLHTITHALHPSCSVVPRPLLQRQLLCCSASHGLVLAPSCQPRSSRAVSRYRWLMYVCTVRRLSAISGCNSMPSQMQGNADELLLGPTMCSPLFTGLDRGRVFGAMQIRRARKAAGIRPQLIACRCVSTAPSTRLASSCHSHSLCSPSDVHLMRGPFGQSLLVRVLACMQPPLSMLFSSAHAASKT